MVKIEPPVRIFKKPTLTNPYLIIGWEDAGLVGSDSTGYLIDTLQAEEFASIDPYDFSFMPYSIIKGGVLKDIEYPKNIFYYWKNNKSANDLIIFSSRLPSINHHKLANLMLDVAEYFKVIRIYTLGGIQAHIAHSGKPRVSAIINSALLKQYIMQYNITINMNYHGPTSMNGLLLGLARKRNIEGISLWGMVADYISEIPNPQVCEVILRTLTKMLNINMDFSEIEEDVKNSKKQIDELVSYIRQQNPRLDRHIERLENDINKNGSAEDRQKVFEDINEFLNHQKGRKENESDF